MFTNCCGNVRPAGETAATDCMPKPLSDMFNTGVTGSELLIISTELRLPVAFGVNVILTVQLWPAGTPAPPIGQVFPEIKKSLEFPLEMVIPLMTRSALPALVMVKVCGVVVVFTVTLPNWKALLLGLMTGAMPVPDTGTDSAVGFELAIASVALREPVAAGLNATLIVQLEPPAKLVVQLFAVMTKSPGSAPIKLTPLMANVPAPAAFDTVTVWAELVVFTKTLPNKSELGDTIPFAEVPTWATFDQPELRFPRMAALYV